MGKPDHRWAKLGDACGLSDAMDNILLDQLEYLAVMDDDRVQKRFLKDLIREYVRLEKQVKSLLNNTLPAPVADEIQFEGRFSPRAYFCTILFSDFASFTLLAEKLSMDQLIETIHVIFSHFDDVVSRHRGTKIKTIGDAYMAVFGAPETYSDHPLEAIRTAREMIEWLEAFNRERDYPFRMRIGIHTGEVMAGVVGRDRMQFDVFGDQVNIASRMESSGEPGRINVSETTYMLTRDRFDFEPRGKIAVKNKPDMNAYFVRSEKSV
ncbi:adenylate/guanylate cyclase domain-containing protein [Desulfatirhabdium butyrativorans]|uniref:adenylate/guanylate cyclase domain-containing protein n=1 Tax=Desulfatirhabdium butyrativorans TaxID=340467 RepID=UPI0004133593|nr:adenylate/guanylate cyclase domain-containing protein [Desulfatirhabdium butyrativorans]